MTTKTITQKQARELGYTIIQLPGGAYNAYNIRKDAGAKALTMKTLLKRIMQIENLI